MGTPRDLKNEWCAIAENMRRNLLPFMEEEMREVLLRDIVSICEFAVRKGLDPRSFDERKVRKQWARQRKKDRSLTD